jgi:predicted transcriptional regulator
MKCEAFVNITRLLKEIFREIEPFSINEDFIRITRLFEDISRELRLLLKNVGLFERF